MFAADLRATDRYLAEVSRDGLFAMSFMDPTNQAGPPELQRFVRTAVHRFAST